MTVTETFKGHKLIAVTARKKVKKKVKKKVVTVGTTSITLNAGESRTVRIALNSTGKRLLAKRHKLKVKLRISQTLSNGQAQDDRDPDPQLQGSQATPVVALVGSQDLHNPRAQRILARVSATPPGFVRTYGDCSPGAPRVTGAVLAACRDDTVPWHRVVRADGSLAKGARQRALLEKEGVPFRGDRVDLRVARMLD